MKAYKNNGTPLPLEMEERQKEMETIGNATKRRRTSSGADAVSHFSIAIPNSHEHDGLRIFQQHLLEARKTRKINKLSSGSQRKSHDLRVLRLLSSEVEFQIN